MRRLIIIAAITATLPCQAAWAQGVESRTSLITSNDMVFGSLSSGPSSLFDLNPDKYLTDKKNSKRHQRTQRRRKPLTLGTWQVMPSLLFGIAFDSNVQKTAGKGRSGFGMRVRPSVFARRTMGSHTTTLFLHGDGQAAPDGRSKLWKVHVGIIHQWEVERNLIVRIAAQFRRSDDIYDRFSNLSPVQASTNTDVAVNTFLGSASVTRKVGRHFYSLGVSALSTSYQNNAAARGIVRTVSTRAGYWVSPTSYVFVESAYNWQEYNIRGLNSRGYRLIGGVGTKRFRLFKGEVFAGYQKQRFTGLGNLSQADVVLGGRVFWFPTRYMAFVAEVDQTLGADSQNSSSGGTRHRSVSVRGRYQLAWNWFATGRVNYTWTDYANSNRRDRTWLAGMAVNYMVASNWGLAMDYSAARVRSNRQGGGYKKHVVTLGLTYRY